MCTYICVHMYVLTVHLSNIHRPVCSIALFLYRLLYTCVNCCIVNRVVHVFMSGSVYLRGRYSSASTVGHIFYHLASSKLDKVGMQCNPFSAHMPFLEMYVLEFYT